jgi:hypothetical protein
MQKKGTSMTLTREESITLMQLLDENLLYVEKNRTYEQATYAEWIDNADDKTVLMIVAEAAETQVNLD